ncbi:MAG TPA: O-antigen ligase family protein [Candidatus Paceibacterota bacterium]|nr:O-antigen ligase family protein [Candidatus Paceibacterota bacterium]
MQGDGTAKQIARWVALGALFLVPFAPLIVTNTYFFPFITGKAFYFRILIEIAVAAWAVLALLDKRYRPRFSWIGVAVVAFVAWMFVADLFAVNVAKAFWSNFERMEGWVLLIHLLGFFVALSAVLRVEKKWRLWFYTSLGVAVIVSIHGILQQLGVMPIHQGSTRIDASFGNSAYFAIYLLFNVFIASWLALTERLKWLKWSLIIFAVVEAVLIILTETRGTVLGLTGALLLAALLTAFTAGGRARRYATWAIGIILVIAGGFYLARDTAFVQDNHSLQRIASISLQAGDVRFTIWHMAFEGVLERPITGWGQEGFNYVFDKFYDPSLYNQEPWFDRAHNAFIDWLVQGGIPAFLLYLSLFGSTIWLLWRRSELSRPERIALTAALAGYACHNLFVFDNLYSYVYFFAILALVDSQVSRPFAKLEALPEMEPGNGMVVALPIAAIIAGVLIWYVNWTGMMASAELITAISPSASGPAANIATFEDLANHPAFAAQEVREQLVSFAAQVVQDPNATTQDKQQVATLAITEMQKQVEAYPLDTRERLQLVYAYRIAGDNADALTQVEAAEKLSPTMESVWIEAGAIEWDLNDSKAAQQDFNTAYQLGPEFPDLAAYAAAGDIVAGDTATADKLLMSAYGTTTVDSDILAVAYYRASDWPKLIALWKLRAAKPGADVQTWFSLAAAYYTAGDKRDTIATLQTIGTLFPDASSSVAAAMAQVLGGKAAGQ